MITCRALVVLAGLLVSGAVAQEQTQRIEPQPWVQGTPSIPDVPDGFPYNVGAMAAGERSERTSDVPLRDYMSSRVDQLRTEILDRIELLDRQMKTLIDERDRQYAQRFSAQEASTAISLSAAKEAVAKAEDAADRRFASVNEFRQSLDDSQRLQLPRAEAEARFKALEERLGGAIERLNNMQTADESATNTWALIGAAVLLLIAIGTFAMGYSRHRAPPPLGR